MSRKVDFKTLASWQDKLNDIIIYKLQTVFWPEYNFSDRAEKYKKQEM